MEPPPCMNNISQEGLLRNEVNWLTLTMLSISRILQSPPELTLKELPDHAKKIMEELVNFRDNLNE